MATTSERRWRRHLRLSVTGLMLLVFAVGGCLGWWLHLARVQRNAVAAILAAGGHVYYDIDLPSDHEISWWNRWLAKYVDLDLVYSVVTARLHKGCGEAELAQVAQLDRLELLSLLGANVTDAGMPNLAKLTQLRSLYVDDVPITDASLVHLEAMTGLENLSLDRTPVTDAGLVHLRGLASLRTLELASTEVGDAGLAFLEGLNSLEELSLQRTKVSDAGLAHLSHLTRLRELDLTRTWVTDAGLASLAGLTDLVHLSISGTKVSDDGLRHLEGLTRLVSLEASSARVTPAGQSKILKVLPGLRVNISCPDWTDSIPKAEESPRIGGDDDSQSESRLFTPTDMPVYVNIYSKDPKIHRKTIDFANDVVLPRLRRIDGVDVPRNLAEDVLAIRVRLNPDRLRANEVSSGDVMKAFAVSTMDADLAHATKAGRVNDNEQIHASPHYSKFEQFAEIILKASSEGDILRVKDIGEVEAISPYFDVFSHVNGRPATTIILKPLPGRSAVVAAGAIGKELKAAPLPPGMDYEVIPLDSRNLIYAVMKAPPDLTLEYVSDRCQDLAAIARGIEGVASVSSLSGYEIRTEDRDWDLGTCLIRLTGRSVRKLTTRQILDALGEKSRTMNVQFRFFEAPGVSVFVAAGGFSVRVLDRANSDDDMQLGSSSGRFMDDLLKRKNLKGIFTFLAGHYPGYELVIDNDAAKQKGVAISDALEHLLAIMGGDLQAEGTFERVAEDFANRFVENERGEMTRYSSFLQLKKKPALNASRR